MSDDCTILIVDDEEVLLETIAYNLEKAGFTTLKVSDGATGLALALQVKPQLIILDVMLPHLSGWEVCRALRKNDEFPEQTPILMLTARSSAADEAKGRAAGATEYLLKPFSMMELVSKVKSLLDRE